MKRIDKVRFLLAQGLGLKARLPIDVKTKDDFLALEAWDTFAITFVRDFLECTSDLLNILDAAKSVLSEEGVKEHLSAYVMGVELINRLEGLEKE